MSFSKLSEEIEIIFSFIDPEDKIYFKNLNRYNNMKYKMLYVDTHEKELDRLIKANNTPRDYLPIKLERKMKSAANCIKFLEVMTKSYDENNFGFISQYLKKFSENKPFSFDDEDIICGWDNTVYTFTHKWECYDMDVDKMIKLCIIDSPFFSKNEKMIFVLMYILDHASIDNISYNPINSCYEYINDKLSDVRYSFDCIRSCTSGYDEQIQLFIDYEKIEYNMCKKFL